MLDALAGARPFRVLVEQGYPDAIGYRGWVDDGSTISELVYFRGGDEGTSDDESIAWATCVRLVDLGDGCDSKKWDLCFRCQESW